MKSVNEIRLLLDKFYEGLSSQEEELAIFEFFNECDDIPADLLADKSVFATLTETKKELNDSIEVPDDLIGELSALIDRKAEKTTNIAPKRNWKIWLNVTGIAASVCALISIGTFLFNSANQSTPSLEVAPIKHAYIPQTEEEAVMETSHALMLVAEKLAVANSRMEYASHRLEELSIN